MVNSWNPKANEIFLRAIEYEAGAQRDQHVHQACGNDAATRERVHQMLRLHEQSSSFLDRPASGVVSVHQKLRAPADPGVSCRDQDESKPTVFDSLRAGFPNVGRVMLRPPAEGSRPNRCVAFPRSASQQTVRSLSA